MARTLVSGVDSSTWIATFGEVAAAAAEVQAAAALYGEPVSQIARRRAPKLEPVAEPDLEFMCKAVSERYQSAVQNNFGRTNEVNFTSSWGRKA